jgi:predicted amidohydrolase
MQPDMAELTPAHLVQHLNALGGTRTPAGVFVALWTYFYTHGLVAAERQLARERVNPKTLEPAPRHLSMRSNDIEACVSSLLTLVEDEDQFDRTALQWLKGLDEALGTGPLKVYVAPTARFEGIDGSKYALRQRNDRIARYFADEDPTSAADQGLSISAYAIDLVVTPERHRGLKIRWDNSWAEPCASLSCRLVQEPQDFVVVIWPLVTRLRFSNVPIGTDHFCLRDLEAADVEDALSAEIQRAVDVASAERATMLLLPELCVTSEAEKSLVTRLAAGDPWSSYPLLTIVGRCHRPSGADGGMYVNEAVIFGPDGQSLHVHTKSVPYKHRGPDGRRRSELLQLGDAIDVLEAPFGNFSVLICLEVFNGTVRDAAGQTATDLVLVPSLSGSTKPHKNAAAILATNRVSTFVANRTYDGEPTRGAESFYRVPRAPGRSEVVADISAAYLVFRIPQ